MRFYAIKLTNPKTGALYTPPGFSGLLGGFSYTSFANGQTLPGALDLYLELPIGPEHTPQGNATIRIFGVSYQEIAQSNNLNGFNIQVFGGMQKGLPLANPAQSGLLMTGTIFQAFGNWIGTQMTLDLVVIPGPQSTATATGGIGTLRAPKNLTLNWPANTPIQQSLSAALAAAFPGVTINPNIGADVVRPNTETGAYPTLQQLAQYVNETSIDIVKADNYTGIKIWFDANGVLNVTDQPSPKPPIQVAFTDLIGQPTWLTPATMQAKAVMRADVGIGSTIKMPPTVVTNTQQGSNPNVNQAATFQGTFTVTEMVHFGQYRQPSADAWVTVLTAATEPVPST